MKKVTLLLSVVLLSACGEDFLDLEPPSQASADGFYKTKSDIEQGVISAYDALQSKGQYGRNFVYFMEVSSDNTRVESITGSGGIYGDFDVFRVVPTNTLLQETWQDCYAGIQRCNIVLNRIQGIGMDESLKSIRVGEVKFIRALTYFNIVRIWGDVPLIVREIQNPFEAFADGRSPVEAVYYQIIADLESAVSQLPDFPAEKGRVTKGAAKTLLAKVRLTQKEYGLAASLLKEVIDSQVYELLPEFTSVFDVKNKNNKESIFEVQFLKGGLHEGSEFVNRFAPLGTAVLTGGVGATYGDNVPTANLLKSFYDEEDKRLPVTIDSIAGEAGRYYTRKFVDVPFQEADAGNNFIVLRYADVLLMYAEALNMISYSANGDAFKYWNQVRHRAGIDQAIPAVFTDRERFDEGIADERRRELACENHRWFDLLRTEKTLSAMNNRFSFVVEAHQLLFPLPQREIDTNPEKVKQNPDYD